jgi:hypothetical protein
MDKIRNLYITSISSQGESKRGATPLAYRLKKTGGHKMSEKFNYGEEVKRLKINDEKDWFRPEAGQYDLIILEEPEKIKKTFNDEEKEQARLLIETNKKQYTWDIGVGETTNSVFGQLMLIAQDRGTLVGEKITLLVKRGKDKNDYTITEALPLMKKEEV